MHKKIELPQHVGIIMDGNRRWARKRNLPLIAGHKEGADRAKKIVTHAFDKGIKHLTLFAFSTENWHRTKYEVNYLMRLALRFIKEQTHELHEKGVCLKIIGSRHRLSKSILTAIDRAEELTAQNAKGTLMMAFNYGGHDDIVQAIQKIVRANVPWNKVNEELVSKNLMTGQYPDPDLIIRTSGEQRTSGFLLWQAAYAELYFSPKLWPDFSTADFDNALTAYATRARRFGA